MQEELPHGELALQRLQGRAFLGAPRGAPGRLGVTKKDPGGRFRMRPRREAQEYPGGPKQTHAGDSKITELGC